MTRLTRKVASRALNALGMGHVKKDLAELRSLLSRSGGGTISPADTVSQLILLNQYRDLVHQRKPLLTFADVEFRSFSQNGEDGILLYVFGLIGMGQRRCVEICAGDGIECNTANLIVNHGFLGLLFDGDKTVGRQRADVLFPSWRHGVFSTQVREFLDHARERQRPLGAERLS